jgi:hypothetical protein
MSYCSARPVVRKNFVRDLLVLTNPPCGAKNSIRHCGVAQVPIKSMVEESCIESLRTRGKSSLRRTMRVVTRIATLTRRPTLLETAATHWQP